MSREFVYQAHVSFVTHVRFGILFSYFYKFLAIDQSKDSRQLGVTSTFSPFDAFHSIADRRSPIADRIIFNPWTETMRSPICILTCRNSMNRILNTFCRNWVRCLDNINKPWVYHFYGPIKKS